MKKNLIFIIIFLALLGIVFAVFKNGSIGKNDNISTSEKKPTTIIDSFQKCADAKYPIQESYPQRCMLPDGTVFIEELPEQSDGIFITAPQVNTLIKSPLEIKGHAVGQWFFEAIFLAELVDEQGKVLATSILTAEGEWMTKDLVPFYGTLEFDEADARGELIFKSANPSGIQENQKIFSVPVRY